MEQTEYIGVGEISKLSDIVKELAPKKIFLVTGKKSYNMSGAERPVTDALSSIEVFHYTVVSALPLEEEVQKGAVACAAFAPDLVIAVGGGHVMDMAKSFNFFSGKKPLVAIPTTAGTGSEATQFAVIFKNGLKTSLESPEMLPTFAIVDPNLAMSVPKEGALPSALDALCQAIESFWSNKATEESRGYAQEALTLVWRNIVPAIEQRDPVAIAALCSGAHLAGKAINISKTTACHAFSYGLTYHFGIPHGVAVALFLPEMYRYNSAVDATQPIFERLNASMGCPDSRSTAEALERMLKGFNIGTVASFGVTKRDAAMLAGEVNADRLNNNPCAIPEGDIINFFQHIV